MKYFKIIMIGCMLFFSAVSWAGLVNVNKADAKTLSMELKGIGLKKATAIVAYRDLNGAFESVEDLTKVKGISDKTIEKNRNNIKLGKK